jgi:hypothetical protein
MIKLKQYYKITVNSPFVWRDSIKLIVNSRKELKNWVKLDIESLKYYFPKRDQYKENNIVKVYKRLKTNTMYCDSKVSGVCYSLRYYPTEQKQEELEDYGDQDYISYWCHKIPQKDLIQYAGFEEIE